MPEIPVLCDKQLSSFGTFGYLQAAAPSCGCASPLSFCATLHRSRRSVRSDRIGSSFFGHAEIPLLARRSPPQPSSIRYRSLFVCARKITNGFLLHCGETWTARVTITSALIVSRTCRSPIRLKCAWICHSVVWQKRSAVKIFFSQIRVDCYAGLGNRRELET